MEGRPAQLAVATTTGARVTGSTVRASDQSKNGRTGDDGQLLTCELCLRESARFTIHHLVPRARGGRFGPKARLCPTCHRQLHALFSETTLAKELHSIELIRANPHMSDFLRWARRQKGPTSFRVRRAKDRR